MRMTLMMSSLNLGVKFTRLTKCITAEEKVEVAPGFITQLFEDKKRPNTHALGTTYFNF